VIGEKNRKEVVLTMGKHMRPEQIAKLLDYNSKWQITGTTLKISMKELGFNWIQGLRESLEAMEKNLGQASEVSSKNSKDTQEKVLKKEKKMKKI